MGFKENLRWKFGNRLNWPNIRKSGATPAKKLPSQNGKIIWRPLYCIKNILFQRSWPPPYLWPQIFFQQRTVRWSRNWSGLYLYLYPIQSNILVRVLKSSSDWTKLTVMDSYHLVTTLLVLGAIGKALTAACLSYFGSGLEVQSQCAPILNTVHWSPNWSSLR